MAFGLPFFRRHQTRLLWLANHWSTRWWFRWVLRINGQRSSVGRRKLVAILPHAIEWEERGSYVAEFRTHRKFAKRLHLAFRPFWWAMHGWDLLADRWMPRLSFGFATLTAYPDADPETTSVDGRAAQFVNPAVGDTWANIRDGAGNDAEDAESGGAIAYIKSATVLNFFAEMRRAFFLFDTSALTSGASISAAVMSLYGFDGSNALATPTVGVYTSAPASNTALASGDFDSVGTTLQSNTTFDYSTFMWGQYNDFPLNATGIGNISKTGITKFGTREVTYDAANSPPTWSSGNDMYVSAYFADRAATTEDPKLVVTYTVAGGGGPRLAAMVNADPIQSLVNAGLAH